MSDIYCPQCGKYHASITVCSNAHLQPVYTQLGTTTIDLDEMRAEIARLQAREAKLREAIRAFCAAESWAAPEWRAQPHIKVLYDIAALRSEPKEKPPLTADAVIRELNAHLEDDDMCRQ